MGQLGLKRNIQPLSDGPQPLFALQLPDAVESINCGYGDAANQHTAANPIISSDIILSLFRGFRGRAWRFFNRAHERGTQVRMTMFPGGFVIAQVSPL